MLHCLCDSYHQDPDAPARQRKHLSELDEKDEQSLTRHLFAYIRAGQVAKVSLTNLACTQHVQLVLWALCACLSMYLEYCVYIIMLYV